MLTFYQQQTSRLLHDPNNVNFPLADITVYINIARGQIASQSQCVRSLDTVNLVSGTETYALPTTGTQAGTGPAIAVLNISVPWGTYTPTMDHYSFSEFQAYFRLFSGTVSGFPECWAQLGDAQSGTVYFFPIPGQAFASLWDCAHTVAPLNTDSDPEAIPYPFTDAVPYFAAYLALVNAQRYNEAKAALTVFTMFMKSARSSVNPLFMGTQYPGIAGDRSGAP